MHERAVKRLRREYEDEFGSMDNITTFTREEIIAKYAKDIAFWHKRIPVINPDKGRPNTNVICMHAICTNAVSNMWDLCQKKGIESEVKVLVPDAVIQTA